MQNCVQDLFDTIFSRYTCYDTVSTYNTTLISLIINYGDISTFCMHGMHDTSLSIEWRSLIETKRSARESKRLSEFCLFLTVKA
jgi:hypothetical protein